MTRRMHTEGFKNPADIHDKTTREELEREVERESFGLDIRVDDKSTELFQKTIQLLEKMGEKYRYAFSEAMKQYFAEHGKLNPVMQEYLREKRMNQLRIEVLDQARADARLEELGFRYKVKPEHVLVIANLPKPLAKFWKKGGYEGHGKIDMQGAAIEWGTLYSRLMPIVWQARESAWENHGISLRRINSYGNHDEDEYYYIWEAEENPPDPIERRFGKW